MDIVMLHGIWDTGGIFLRMAAHLEAQGHHCVRPNMEPANGAHGLIDLAVKMRDQIDTQLGTETPLAMVGFSMGALVARHYLQVLGGAARTSHFFSLSGPHHGTLNAHIWPGKAAKDMRFGSDFLKRLNSDVNALQGIEAHSYRTSWDLMILPPGSSRVDWAVNHRVPAAFHHRMVAQRPVFEHIGKVLASAKGARGIPPW